MKEKLFALLLGFCALNAAFADEKEEILLKENDQSEWIGMVKLNTDVKRSGDSSFELYGKYPTELISSRMFPIDMDKTYVLSAWLRSLNADSPASASFGMRMYDKDKHPIVIANVCVRPGTETTLSADAAQGATELLVTKNPEWLKTQYSAIAFNIQDNYQDLPNFNVSPQVEKMVDEENQYRVILKGPLKKDYPAGTKIRLHAPWGAPFYWVAQDWIPAEWKEFSTTMKGEAQSGTPTDKFWKGTKYVRIFVWFGNYNRIPKQDARLLVDDIRFVSK